MVSQMLAEDKRPWIRDKNNSALPTSDCGVYFNPPSMASHIVWHRSVIDGASAPTMGIQNGWRTLGIGNVNFYDKQCKMCKSWQTRSELSINCIRKRLWPGGPNNILSFGTVIWKTNKHAYIEVTTTEEWVLKIWSVSWKHAFAKYSKYSRHCYFRQ